MDRRREFIEFERNSQSFSEIAGGRAEKIEEFLTKVPLSRI